MASALTERGVAPEAGGTDNPFHDPVMIGIGIVAFIVTLVIPGPALR